MEQNTDDLKAHLMATSDEFRGLAAKHAEYDQLLQSLEAKNHLTPEEEMEEHRLKKLKLQLKDQMNEFLQRVKTQVA